MFIMQAHRLATNEPGKVYVAFKKIGGEKAMPVGTFSNVLKFTSKEIDPTTNEPEEVGYDDEYEVAEFDLTGSDYLVPTFAGSFNHVWEQVGATGEQAEETLSLSNMKGIAGKSGGLIVGSATWRSVADMLCVCVCVCRGYGTIDQDAVATTVGRHRCAHEPDDAHAQAARQDGQRRQGGGQCADGLFVQVRRHDQDRSPERGGERGGIGCGVDFVRRRGQCQLMMGLMVFFGFVALCWNPACTT
jgi:hypothetical protein